MKQVFLAGGGSVEILDSPVPARLEGSVLVRNRFSLISTGTEGAATTRHRGVVGLYEKAVASRDRAGQVWAMAETQGVRQTFNVVRNKLSNYTPLGYSSVGTIVEVAGDDVPFDIGEHVACMGAGFASHAEYVVVPKNLVARVPAGAAIDQAAFAALACIAMQGIRRLELTSGERVGVVGLGLIGQITIRLLTAMGFRPFGMDLVAERVALAQRVPDAECWASSEFDSATHVLNLTDGIGLDGVIVCAATSGDEPVNLAFDLCRRNGRVAIVGDVGLGLERNKMYAKELDLLMSCSYGKGRYDKKYELDGEDYALDHVRWSQGRNLEHFMWLLGSGRCDLSDLITDRVSIDNAIDAYARIKSGEASLLGLLLDYGEPPEQRRLAAEVAGGVVVERQTTSSTRRLRVERGRVRLAIIGAGGYVTGMHLPQLRRLSDDFAVEAIVSRSGASAAAAAKRFDVPSAASDYRAVLEDAEIDAVLVATRHATHAKIALDALDAGKHVFVEKPMATTVEDAEAIVRKASETGLTVRVGFNRRFSAYVHALREAIGAVDQAALTMRVNLGSTGQADWSNTREEGGRLLGEGVHFFDLANWFFADEPNVIRAQSIGEMDVTNPNRYISLAYPGGGLANVVYTTLGHKGMGKEYFEVFGGGRSACMNDYRSIEAFGVKVSSGMRRGDKGQRDCLREFAAAVRGETFSVQGADALAGLAATRIALQASG